ncbi:MAG: transglutaminase family protein [bacterium]
MRYRARFWRVSLIFLLWLAVAAFTWNHTRPVQAAGEFSYKIDLNYRLDDDGSTVVTSTYRVTNNTNNKILASLLINTPTSDANELTATLLDGTPISKQVSDKTSTALGYSYQYKEIALTFQDWPGGRGTVESFVVSYRTSELVDIKGASRTFYAPSLAQIGEDEDYAVSVSVPLSFGRLYASGAMPVIDGSDGNRVRYRFVNSADLKRSVALIFGDTTVYKVDLIYPLANTSKRDRIITVTLPPDTGSQKIFINKLDPAPLSTRIDADGNILADYKVAAGQTITVHTDIAAQVKYQEYDFSKGGTLNQVPAELTKQYTGPTRYWQTQDPELVKQAKAAVAGKTKVADMMLALQQLTINTLSYNNEKIKYNIRQGSSKALRNPDNAVCLEYSDLLVSLLRSQGIPARMPVGYAYAGNLKQSKSVTDSLHSWVEAYLPGLGWINLDPTWGEKFDTFGKSDLDHFAFAIWGQNDSLPAAVMIDNQDTNYQYEQTKVSYDTAFPSVKGTGNAVATTFVLFPGVSYVDYRITGPDNVAGDKYAVLLKKDGMNQERIEIGSMAPFQQVKRVMFLVGDNFAKSAQLVFVQNTAQGDVVLAAGTGQVVWWPMMLIFLLIAGVAALILLQYIIRNQRSKNHLSHPVQRPKAMEDALAALHNPDRVKAETTYTEAKKHDDEFPIPR